MAASTARTDLIVLLPGLWMPAGVMLPLAWRLRGAGLSCVRFGYPSMTGSLEENADRLADRVRSLDAGTVHLVGHSLGGVLALHATSSRRLARVRSIVMLGSPAQGSHAAERLAQRGWSRRLLGRTIPEWLSAPRPSAPEGVAVGVIAGTHALGLGMMFVPDLPRPHDGVIRVAETAVNGASDRIEVPVSHTALLTSGRVAALVAAFIRHGRFGVWIGARASSVPATGVSRENRAGRAR